MSFRSLLVLLALVTAAPASAQQTHPAPLRVSSPSPLRQDSLLPPSYVPPALIERSRISPRTRRTLLGAVAGFAVSTAVVVASDPGSWDCGGEFCGLGQSILIVGGATIAGAIIGYATAR